MSETDQPKAIKKNFKCAIGDTYKIYFIGDLHIGKAFVNYKMISRVVDAISSDPKSYWIGMGDYLDCILLADKRINISDYDPKIYDCLRKLDQIIDWQCWQFEKFFAPIRDRCLGLLCGNHEDKLRKKINRDIIQEIASKWQVAYPGYGGWWRLTWEYDNAVLGITIYANHGYSAPRTGGGSLSSVMRDTAVIDADIIVYAHCHNIAMRPQQIIYLDKRGNVRTKLRHYVITGTYREEATIGRSYETERSYFSAPNGIVWVEITPFLTKREHLQIKVSYS